jgi:hypothetical protein
MSQLVCLKGFYGRYVCFWLVLFMLSHFVPGLSELFAKHYFRLIDNKFLSLREEGHSDQAAPAVPDQPVIVLPNRPLTLQDLQSALDACPRARPVISSMLLSGQWRGDITEEIADSHDLNLSLFVAGC